MSRIGKHAVIVPQGVEVQLEGNALKIKGPLGSEETLIPGVLKIAIEEQRICLAPKEASSRARALWGTYRNLISNAVRGLTAPFEKRIALVGVGFKAEVQNNKLFMQLGYSHPIEWNIPDKVSIVCEKPTQITVRSSYKHLLGQVVSHLISYRPPEPYKGKGMILEGKPVLRKEGKKK